MSNRTPDFEAYTVIEREGQERGYWLRIGAGWENRDGSINVVLNALPVNGRLNLRAAEDDSASETAQEGPGDAPA